MTNEKTKTYDNRTIVEIVRDQQPIPTRYNKYRRDDWKPFTPQLQGGAQKFAGEYKVEGNIGTIRFTTKRPKATPRDWLFALTWLLILIGLPAFWIYIFVSQLP